MVRIGTWNLENLFSPEEGTKQSEYDTKLDTLAATITDLAPDVLAVQEVGDPVALEDLAGRLSGDWHTALADPDGRGIRVGFLSQAALTNITQIQDFPTELAPVQVADDGSVIEAMGRPALHARVRRDNRSVDIISTHLKSKLLSYPGGRFSPRDEGERARYAVYALNRRAAEAAAVRAGADEFLDGQGEDRAVVVAGDLNDEPQAATTQILLGPGGSEIGTAGFERADQGDPRRLWNLAPLIPERERFSRVYRGRGELIDHLLVSHALVDLVTEVSTGGVDLPSITDTPTQRRGEAGSDHRPVVATFNP